MEIIFNLAILLAIFIPYIMCVILAVIIICLIQTKLIKSNAIKILIIISILLCVYMILSNIKDERPNDLYVEMKEINDNQSLIGLSKEQVVIMLGKPVHEYNSDDNTIYRYDAGNIGKGLFFGNKAILFDSYDGYELNVVFNENDRVKSTSIQFVP